MNKQQLATLETALKEGTILANDHDPASPLEDGGPYTYVIHFDQGTGQYLLDLVEWSDYYHYHATRSQPEEEGWATLESMVEGFLFLSELLQQLEDRGIPLPTLPPSEAQQVLDAAAAAWSHPCPGVYVRTPLPSPAEQVGTAAIARGTAGA